MKIRNAHSGVVHVLGTGIAPGRALEVDAVRYADWLRASPANRDIASRYLSISPEGVTVPREEAIDAAVRGLNLGDPSLWTSGGKPTLPALRDRAGVGPVSSAERDAAWERVNGRESP